MCHELIAYSLLAVIVLLVGLALFALWDMGRWRFP
jgi:hypothetical protein